MVTFTDPLHDRIETARLELRVVERIATEASEADETSEKLPIIVVSKTISSLFAQRGASLQCLNGCLFNIVV